MKRRKTGKSEGDIVSVSFFYDIQYLMLITIKYISGGMTISTDHISTLHWIDPN